MQRAPVARADAALNRTRLILAARDLVGEHGLGVGVRAIADRAEVGVTTLYRHFPDKQALIDSLSIHRWATMAELARWQGDREPLRGVVVLLDTFSRMVTADAAFIEAAGLRVGYTPPGIQPLKLRFEPIFASLWATAQHQDQIRLGTDPRDAMELAGMIRRPERRPHMLRVVVDGVCTDAIDGDRLLREALRGR